MGSQYKNSVKAEKKLLTFEFWTRWDKNPSKS